MPGISQSVSNTSLTPPLQCLSLSPFLSRFSIGKTKRTPKDEWRLESSFLHVPLRPSVYPSSQSLFSSSFFLCFSAKSHIDDHSFPANSGRPDARYVLRAENSLSQNTRGIQRFSQNGGMDLRDVLTQGGRKFGDLIAVNRIPALPPPRRRVPGGRTEASLQTASEVTSGLRVGW